MIKSTFKCNKNKRQGCGRENSEFVKSLLAIN